MGGGLQAEAMPLEEVFQNIMHIQTYNWTKYAICWSTVSGGLQAQAMDFRRSHWNIIHIQTYNWTKYALFEGTLSGGLQAEAIAFRRKFSKRIYTFKHTIAQSMRSVEVLSGGLQAEAMAFRIFFSKQYKHSNIQLNKVWALWNYSEWWASSSSNGFQRKFLKTLYTFKYTFEQCMRSVKVHWLVGFKQKQCLSEEIFQKQFTHSNIQLQEVCTL